MHYVLDTPLTTQMNYQIHVLAYADIDAEEPEWVYANEQPTLKEAYKKARSYVRAVGVTTRIVHNLSVWII